MSDEELGKLAAIMFSSNLALTAQSWGIWLFSFTGVTSSCTPKKNAEGRSAVCEALPGTH